MITDILSKLWQGTVGSRGTNTSNALAGSSVGRDLFRPFDRPIAWDVTGPQGPMGPTEGGTSAPSNAANGGPQPMTADDLLAYFAGGDANSGPNIADLTRQVNESYDRRLGALAENKAKAEAAIRNLTQQYSSGLQQNQSSYQQGMDAINAEIARRATEAAQRTTETSQQLANAAALEGVNAESIRGQAANIANMQAQADQFQRDLAARTAQIAAENYRNAMNAGQLVQQGAIGSVESGYGQLLSALQNAREQEIMSLSTNASRGGGGGGSSAKNDPIKKASDYLEYIKLFSDVNKQPLDMTSLSSLMMAAAEDDPASLFGYLSSLTPEQRAAMGIRA